ncbi:MAG: fructose-1,6-bisphosphate aldolase/phosphatase [Deltaproteobacteria bacterium]|nr:fructose-1,6-bisphosphate aldolase/phosphatase [Deltaproteobacteria bacterium]
MGPEKKLTLSVIKADVGGWVGHCATHPEMLARAQEHLHKAVERGFLIDAQALNVGDDIELIMTHNRGEDNSEIHQFAWDTFLDLTELAKRLKLYGAGQDMLADAFSGNVKGMGPGVAEMSFVERKSEPIVIFMADKTSPGAWNLPLFKIFGDPFNTAGLVIDPSMHRGFRFRVLDVFEEKEWFLSCPEDMYDLLVLIGASGRYVIENIYRKKDNEVAAVASSQKLGLIAGRYVGKDDPVLAVRCQSGFPAVGEVLEPFAFPHLVEGWMRGSHHGPLMPVSFADARPIRFDGPPRVIAAGFQLCEGKLIGPVDLFSDVAFDEARKEANRMATYMRRHGPFEPHRLGLHEMEYTTLPQVMAFIFEKSAIPRRSDLEDELQKLFPHLRELRVVDPGIKDLGAIQKTVAREGAHYVEEIAWPGAKIGLSGGKTLYFLVTYLEPERLSGIHIYPLTLTPILTMPGLTANAMVGMMSTKYPDATAYNLPTIPVTSREEYEKRMAANPEMLKIYKDIWDVDIMVLGIGYLTGPLPGFRALAQQEMGLTAEDLAAKGVVGEINHTPINAEGEPMLDTEDKDLAALTRRVIGVGALELRERAAQEGKYVVAVAGGLEKIEAIRAALKGRYFNVLITDAYVAEALVRKTG